MVVCGDRLTSEPPSATACSGIAPLFYPCLPPAKPHVYISYSILAGQIIARLEIPSDRALIYVETFLILKPLIVLWR